MENREENKTEQQTEKKEFQEITLKFGKGCVGESFTGKDGKEYTQILIPNSDPEDHRPWATFVARANAVHEDKYGKGMWLKLPSEGHTTVRRNVRVGEDEQGKGIFEREEKRVANQELKGMVEFYKSKGKEQKPSIRQKMEEKKAVVQQALAEKGLEGKVKTAEAVL
ncbi:MAG: hypothetical protein IJL07_01140 [Lachnospiraceae bacterium]|nr:hypothetical protein [Lachnospiraceae bacterium]